MYIYFFKSTLELSYSTGPFPRHIPDVNIICHDLIHTTICFNLPKTRYNKPNTLSFNVLEF